MLDAFRDLILTRRYANIRVGDIVRRANVGRSTFYEHFRDKDDLLCESISGLLAIMADIFSDRYDMKRLCFVMDHFRENSRLARGMFNGPSAPQFVHVLANLIEEHLATTCPRKGLTPSIPLEIIAFQAAETMLGLVRAWLQKGISCSAAVIAAAMHKSATAAVNVLLLPARQ